MKTRSKGIVCLERFAQLFALTGLALSSPLLNIIKDGPEFFVNRRALPADIITTVIGVVVIPPLVLFLIEAVARLAGRRVASIVHYMFIAVLVALVVVSLLAHHADIAGTAAVALGVVAGVIVSVLVARSSAAQTWLAFVSVLTVISVATFASTEGVANLLSPHSTTSDRDRFTETSKTPVAVLIFDEFPLNGLLNQQLEIDEYRFPNFAALAKESTWFRRAAAVNQFTPIALPAILSGRMPRSTKQLPIVENYPANLFTILSRSHAVTAYEPFTKLCPDDVCRKEKRRESRETRLRLIFWDLVAVYLNYAAPRDLELGIPDIDGKWGDFWSETSADWEAPNFSRSGRVESFQRFVKSIKPSEKPPLIFAHVIIPHMPHQFVPSGAIYPPGIVGGYVRDRWVDDPALIQIGYQQFLLQLGAADRVLGWFIERLKEIGVYDNALVVVVADHGASFQPETYRRGNVNHNAFYEDVMSIPLFIKRPGVAQGNVSDQHAQTIDVLPTILDLLGLNYQLTFDGVPLFNPDARNR